MRLWRQDPASVLHSPWAGLMSHCCQWRPGLEIPSAADMVKEPDGASKGADPRVRLLGAGTKPVLCSIAPRGCPLFREQWLRLAARILRGSRGSTISPGTYLQCKGHPTFMCCRWTARVRECADLSTASAGVAHNVSIADSTCDEVHTDHSQSMEGASVARRL